MSVILDTRYRILKWYVKQHSCVYAVIKQFNTVSITRQHYLHASHNRSLPVPLQSLDTKMHPGVPILTNKQTREKQWKHSCTRLIA